MPDRSRFPYIRVSGGAYERGLAYGSLASDRIRKTLDMYLPAFAARGLDWPRVRSIARELLVAIEQSHSMLAEEMKGIAAGAALEIEHIVAVNARTELLFWEEAACTSAACLPAVTADHHTILAQNWDWRPATIDSSVVLHVLPDDGPEFLTFVEAGLLARAGLNSAGLGVVGNFLQSDQDFAHGGVPAPVIRRRILGSRCLAEALTWIVRSPRAFSSNHLVAAADAGVVDCEAAPSDVFFLHPSDGLLTHSNHFQAPAAAVRLRDTGIARFPDTLYRSARLRMLLDTQSSISLQRVTTALGDHAGWPFGICRHLPSEPEDGNIVTVASLVMDLDAGLLWLAAGPPCRAAYQQLRLESRITVTEQARSVSPDVPDSPTATVPRVS